MLIAIKDSIPASVISSIPSNHAPEIVTVRLNLRKTTILSCVYLPPSPSDSNMNDAISNLTQITDANPSADIFVGDFNLPDVQWDTLSSTSSTSCAFCDFVFDHSLTQLINHPTHVQGNILDLVLSSSIDCVASLTVANDNNWIATDHFTVTFQLSQQTHLTPTTTPKYVFDYPKANYDSILSYLTNFDYSPCFQSQDIELIWLTIKNSIDTAMHLFIPKVRLRRHQFPCWYTPELRHLSKCLRSAKKRFTKHATPHLQLKINNLESEYRSKILLAKSNYESRLVQSFAGSHNSKIYDYIQTLCKSRSIPLTVSLNESNATSDTDKAELF